MLIAVVGLVCLSTHAAEMRTWTAAEGGYQIRAEMLELSADGVVALRGLDGRRLEVRLDRLSDDDQKYARTQIQLLANRGSTESVTAARVESEALQCKTAKTALLVYQSYLNGEQLDPAERALVEAKLPQWKNLADRSFVRLGRQWLAKSEADKIRADADDMVTHAIELLRLKSDEAAKQILDKATRLDPDSPKAEFLMGFVYGLVAYNDVRAIMHFENALRREPKNVSTLNNLAVSEFFERRYAQAVNHWAEAAALSPQNKHLLENLATVLEIQGKRVRNWRLPPYQLDKLSESYRVMLNQKGMSPPKKREKIAFWYLSPYGREWALVDGTADKTNPDSGESVITGGGSGFVVAAGYVLTNHHVVEGSDSLLIMNPASKDEDPLPATVVASDAEADLAILYCEKLKAPPLALSDNLPRRGSDVMVLGFPEMFDLGYHLKSTRGSVTALPAGATSGMLLLDALANPGNSGGPICDEHGCVVAVLTAGFTFQNNYTAGVPTTVALPFLQKNISGFKPVLPANEKLTWPDVDAKVAPSTVMILRKQNTVTDAGFGGRGKDRGVEDEKKKDD
jgi:S1-C subfamily serine protease